MFDFLGGVDAVFLHPGVVSFAEAGGVEAGGEPADLIDGHPVVQRGFVGHVADGATDVAALGLGGEAEDLGGAGGGWDESHEEGDGGGFAGSVFAEEGDDASGFALHGEGFEGGFVAVGFGDGGEGEDGIGHGGPRNW